jgi:hypothetical protein
MSPSALGTVFGDRPSPFERFDEATRELVGKDCTATACRREA